ncbi:MAG: UDP-N-acetylmuramoyl-tripeptide--D-alanyl-D-alanine ligase [Nitrospinota bacterium]
MSEVNTVAVFTARQIARAVGGRLLRGGEEMEASGVSTDSRTLAPGELFIPLIGPNFDGHGFIGKAEASGAAGALVERGRAFAGGEGFFLVEVEDTLRALGDLARFHRGRHEVTVAAVTGSNGKTTAKEMIASIFAQGAETLKSEGNLNNLVGLPLQVLRLTPEHARAVFEMGMNQPGEIRRLAGIALPGIGVITNVGPAHLEGLGSVEAVREAKGELLEAMGARGRAVLSAEDPHSRLLARRFREAGGEVLSFGFSRECGVQGDEVVVSPRGTSFRLRLNGAEARVRLPALGRPNVLNALAAAGAASLAGCTMEEIAAGLEGASIPKMRLEVRPLARREGCFLIDDAYNANPASVLQALEVASQLRGGGRLFALLGDMKELGRCAEEAHREVGRAAARAADFVAGVGPMMGRAVEEARRAGLAAEHFESPMAAAEWARGQLRGGDWVLVKGSRSMRMERAIEVLEG